MLSGKAKLDSIRSPNIQSLNWICLTTWYAMGIKWDERRTQKSSAYCEILYVQMMKMWCVSCKKNTANKNWSIRWTKQNRLMLLSNCAVCGSLKIKTFIT